MASSILSGPAGKDPLTSSSFRPPIGTGADPNADDPGAFDERPPYRLTAGLKHERSNLTLVKKAAISLLLIGSLSSALNAPDVDASTRWRDVNLEIPGGRAAAYDPQTGRIIILTPVPLQERAEIAAFRPGVATPVWRRSFAPAPAHWKYGSSYASAVLVAPKDHLVYVGGGYSGGTASGSYTSAGYIYAFDTRTGQKVWSHKDRPSSGTGGIYDHLVKGPSRSVIAVEREFMGGQPSSGSYATEVASFGPRGRQRWRWIDRRRGLVDDVTTTRGGLIVLIGETYVNGYARAYRVALDGNGRVSWRHVGSDPWEYFYAIATSHRNRTLYVAGGQGTDRGSDATVTALNSANGRIRWRRLIEAPSPELPGDLSYFASSAVTATKRGPCLTGEWEGRRAVTYQPILPDNGFITCYSQTGRRRWIDSSTDAPGGVLQRSGRLLLWIGRQEVSRTETNNNSQEVVRFAIRSLASGVVRHSSERFATTDTWRPSGPLLAIRKNGTFHFIVRTAPEYDTNGDETSPGGVLDRIFR